MFGRRPSLMVNPHLNVAITINPTKSILGILDQFHPLCIWVRQVEPRFPCIIRYPRNPEAETDRFHRVLFPIFVDDPILRFASGALRISFFISDRPM